MIDSVSLISPGEPSALIAAVTWLSHAMIGTIATAIAIVAVAWVGALMLSGRLDVRRIASVALGCFLIFGAAEIVAGIQSATGQVQERAIPMAKPAVPPPTPPAPPPAQAYDPYAGAAVPIR